MNERTEGIIRQAGELIEQAYQRGFKLGKAEGYSKAETDYYTQTEKDRQSSYELGLSEAWACADKLNRMTLDEVMSVFADDPLADIITRESIFRCCLPELAINKVREWEEKQKQDDEIRVGDEVVSNTGGKGIVLSYYDETDSCGNIKERWLIVYMPFYDVPQTVTKNR